MKNVKGLLFVLSLLCLAAALPALAQNPGATPVTVNDDEVVRIQTNLIQVDAIVTDKSGKVISDLKPDDFELSENGKKRELAGFSFVNTDTRAASLSKELLLSSSNSQFSDTPPRTIGQVGRIFAIVFDDLNIKDRDSVEYAKRDLIKFVQTEVQPSDLVAIVKTSGSVGILQKFTNDKDELLAAIESIKWNALSIVGADPFVPVGISLSQTVLSDVSGFSSKASGAGAAGGVPNAAGIGNAIRDTTNAVGGLQVLKKVIDAMGFMRGKKSILFVSYGLNRFSQSDRSVINSTNGNSITLVDQDSITVAGKNFVVNNFLRVITESANRNSVSIFPIDPRGNKTSAIKADLNTASGAMDTTSTMGTSALSDGGDTDTMRYQQDTLKYMARETGGRAFVNSNEVAGDLKEALDIQKGYYLLAYEPDSETFDPNSSKYNKFDIKVKRSGVNVSFRTGFFNVITNNKEQAASNENQVMQKLLSPYNYPDVGVELSSLYAGTANNRSTIRSFVNIIPKDLTIADDADGKKSAKFDVFVAVFNNQGIAAGSAAQSFAVSFDPKGLDGFYKSGLVSSMGFDVDKPGVYRIKVLVRDAASNRIGTISQSIYVPDMNKQPLSFSGLLLQTFSPAEWAEVQKNPGAANPQKMQIDTAFRHYKTGQVLTYTYSLGFSPNAGDSKVSISTKLMKDGQVVFNGNPEEAAAVAGQKVNRRNAINLGTEMKPGKYTLQISAVGDKSQKPETESIDFEVLP